MLRFLVASVKRTRQRRTLAAPNLIAKTESFPPISSAAADAVFGAKYFDQHCWKITKELAPIGAVSVSHAMYMSTQATCIFLDHLDYMHTHTCVLVLYVCFLLILYTYLYMCVYLHTYIYIYIYIYHNAHRWC